MTAAAVVVEQELFRACEVLFGSELRLTRDFLLYLQPAGVKSAFRRRARETHPDLAEGDRSQAAAMFQAVKKAYDDLSAFLEARERGVRFVTAAQPQSPSPPRSRAASRPRPAHRPRQHQDAGRAWQERMARRYQGAIPQRPMPLGHFLYYSGVATWRDIVRALVWQRSQRPRLGELGCRMGWLAEADVHRILQYRTAVRPFGATAVNLGLLTPLQLRILLAQQRRRQQRIGGFFVDQGLVSRAELDRLVLAHLRHNRLFGQGRA